MENNEQKTKWFNWLLKTERINTGNHIQLENVIEDVSILKKLESEGNLKLRLVEGFGYFNYPCDLCRQTDETGAYNLALDLPENTKNFTGDYAATYVPNAVEDSRQDF